ncbi:type II secretion system protein GspL [Delftia sp. PS-11]|uniref:type II secretion system protein GspL n=1 Tax=Delftia sp. PS-11 TaxID=2767222 RepID=UPI00245600B1|nr:type II secretion system protein GspL [Delftia sp. PS-11]KAJ8740810.1 general secretion pathway protein GspL [Delftia sp. PS-11]
MSTLILHLPAGPAGEYAYALSSDGQRADRHGHAAAALLPDPGRAGQTVAVVPHQALSWHLVHLPQGVPTGGRRGHARLRAVLDGLLEERLLDDPSQLHLALQPQAQAGSPCWVAACDKAWLRSHLQALESAGRAVGRIVPAFTPQMGAQLHAVGTPESAWLLATGLPSGALACLPLGCERADPAAVASVLQALPDTPIQAEPALVRLAEGLQRPVSLVTEAERGLAASAQNWDLAQFEFDQGGQSRTRRRLLEHWQSFWRAPQWRGARGALMLALVAQVAGLNAWAWKENHAIAAKQMQARAALASSFPQVPVIIDAPVQMQREVAALRQASGALTPGDLEPLLAAVAQALPASAQAQGLDFHDRQLRLQGITLEAEALAEAQQRLAGSGLRLQRDGADLVLAAETAP